MSVNVVIDVWCTMLGLDGTLCVCDVVFSVDLLMWMWIRGIVFGGGMYLVSFTCSW